MADITQSKEDKYRSSESDTQCDIQQPQQCISQQAICQTAQDISQQKTPPALPKKESRCCQKSSNSL